MIYAVVANKTDAAVTTDGIRPVVPIVAFGNKADFDSYQDRLWQSNSHEGQNLVRVPRKQVVKWFGRNFELADYSLAVMGGVSIALVVTAADKEERDRAEGFVPPERLVNYTMPCPAAIPGKS